MSDTTQATAENAGPTINLVDLQNVLRIIDAAAERGAFKGNELSVVGQVRDKVATFLEAVLPKQEESVEPEAEEVSAPKKSSRAKKA
jgi:hypothetical protein